MKQKLNYLIDVCILIAFGLCGITGILKMPLLNVPLDLALYAKISVIHDWTGIAGFALSAVHVILHAQWLTKMTAQIFRGRKTSPAAVVPSAKKSFGTKTAVFIISALLITQSAGNLWADHRRFSNATVPQGIDYQSGSLKDGTYTGTANGYMPSLTVEVTVKGGKISNVKIVSNRETPRWYNAVANVIPQRIVANQSTDIDMVSGATCSSQGIMSAVEAALQKAAK